MQYRRVITVLLLSVFVALAASAQSFTTAKYATGAGPSSVVVGDFNHDGVTDLATSNRDGSSVSVLLGRGDGSFAAKIDFAVGSRPAWIAAADLNGDGNLDLVTANSGANSVTVLFGDGHGGFAGRVDVPAGKSPSSVAIADFNRDGKLDIAVANTGDGAVQILVGNNGVFTAGPVTATPDGPPQALVAGDFNGDGVTDLAVATCCAGTDVSYGIADLLVGNGDGTFGVHTLFNTANGTAITAADVNKDSRPDLVTPGRGCHTPCAVVGVAVNTGGGSFDQSKGLNVDPDLVGVPGSAAVGDFNGDGIADIAVPWTPGDNEFAFGKSLDKVFVYLGKADGTYEVGGAFSLGTRTSPVASVAADFNRDGKADIAVVNAGASTVTVLLSGNAAADFDVNVTPASQAVAAGNKAQYSIYVEATRGTLPNVQLSCTGLPQGAACSFDPASLHDSTYSSPFLTITTTARQHAALHHPFAGWAFLASILPFGFVAIGRRRRAATLVGLLALVIAFSLLQIGCGGATSATNSTGLNSNANQTSNNGSTGTTSGSTGSTSAGGSGTTSGTGSSGQPGGTPAGTYQISVVASGGGQQHSATVTLIVQ